MHKQTQERIPEGAKIIKEQSMEAKQDEKMPEYLTVEISHNGELWGSFEVLKKEFKTGSMGFFGVGKMANPEKPAARYQGNMNLVLIGSKPK